MEEKKQHLVVEKVFPIQSSNFQMIMENKEKGFIVWDNGKNVAFSLQKYSTCRKKYICRANLEGIEVDFIVCGNESFFKVVLENGITKNVVSNLSASQLHSISSSNNNLKIFFDFSSYIKEDSLFDWDSFSKILLSFSSPKEEVV